MVYIANAIRSQKPSLGRVAVSAFYDDRYRKGSDVQRNAHSLHPLSEGVAKTAFHFVTEQRPDLHCIMQGEFCQKMPPWVYGGVPLEGASLLYIRLEIISVRRGEFRRLRAASDFPSDGKVTKGSPGDAADGHFVPIGPLTPGSPFTGVIPWSGQSISSAQNLSDTLNSRRATGPWVSEN